MTKLPLILGAAAGIPAAAAAQTGVAKPNIVIIMADQMRADLCAREGFPLDLTPFLDKMAKEGAWFDRAYTTAPASVPARTSMMTGRWPNATRVRSNHNINDAVYGKDIFMTAREHGYKTALIGKNHTYLTPDRVDYWSVYDHVGKQGKNKTAGDAKFDDFLKSTAMYASFDKGSPGGVEEQQPYRIVSEATRWVAQNKDNPFLMLVSFPEPHNPYQVCEPYFSMFPPDRLPACRTDTSAFARLDGRYRQLSQMMNAATGYLANLDKLRSVYMGMIRLEDDQIKRFIDEVVKTGVYDNTVFIFLADHGDYAGEYGLMKKGVGMSDPLARIPFVVWGKGVEKSGLREAHISIADLYPTICEAIGAEIPMGVQGRSLWPMLSGKPYPEEEFASVMVEDGYGGQYYTAKDGTDYKAEGCITDQKNFFDELNTWTQSGSRRMLREGDWKLVYDMTGRGELYNLRQDPSEIDNLFGKAQYQDVQGRLMGDMMRWAISTEDPLPIPQHRYIFKRYPHNYLFCPE